MNFFSRMKSLAKSGTEQDLDAALADLDAQERAEQATIARLKDELGAAVVRGDEAAVARIQSEKAEAINRLELMPIARAELLRRRVQAETAKAEAELLATMAEAEKANGRRREALRRLHRLFVEVTALLEAEQAADKTVREANAAARAAGRPDLQVEAIEAEAARRRAKLVAELGTSLSLGPVDFGLGLTRLAGYTPDVPFSADREFMVRPLSLIN